MKRGLIVIAAIAATIVALLMAPAANVEAASKKMPKNGQKFSSVTFTENAKLKGMDGTCHWIVKKVDGVKKYYPVFETKECTYYAPSMYVQIGKRLYYTDKDGAISWGKNPEGYKVSKYGYCIIPKEDTSKQEEIKQDDKKEEKQDDTKKVEDSKTGKTSKASIPEGYTVKVVSGTYQCYKDGVTVTGFVGPYYFDSWSGMALGLKWIDGDYYYFSEDLETLGRMVTGWQKVSNGWMYFDPSTGKSIHDQKLETKDGKIYYLDSSGFMATGWHGNDYYSAEADRYGQLVYSK